MSNSLTASGSTRLSWTLTSTQSVGSTTRTAEIRTSRTITNGTGADQATVGYSNTHTVTGTATVEFDFAGIEYDSFGSTGIVAFSDIREILVKVAATTGAQLFVGYATGVTGHRVPYGGEYHLCSYTTGIAVSDWAGSALRIHNPTSTAVDIDIAIIGVGTFSS
jgi:hypothetical protein